MALTNRAAPARVLLSLHSVLDYASVVTKSLYRKVIIIPRLQSSRGPKVFAVAELFLDIAGPDVKPSALDLGHGIRHGLFFRRVREPFGRPGQSGRLRSAQELRRRSGTDRRRPAEKGCTGGRTP